MPITQVYSWSGTWSSTPELRSAGIEITRNHHSISISQKLYIESILRREGMKRVNPVSMPLDSNSILDRIPMAARGIASNSYARLLGELQFLASATRLDNSYTDNRLASYTANPSLENVGASKRILCYLSLAGTRTHAITYNGSHSHTNSFREYANAAYANADDCKSTPGHVFLAGGGAITWRPKKQTTVALSSNGSRVRGKVLQWLRAFYV